MAAAAVTLPKKSSAFARQRVKVVNLPVFCCPVRSQTTLAHRKKSGAPRGTPQITVSLQPSPSGVAATLVVRRAAQAGWQRRLGWHRSFPSTRGGCFCACPGAVAICASHRHGTKRTKAIDRVRMLQCSKIQRGGLLWYPKRRRFGWTWVCLHVLRHHTSHFNLILKYLYEPERRLQP